MNIIKKKTPLLMSLMLILALTATVVSVSETMAKSQKENIIKIYSEIGTYPIS